MPPQHIEDEERRLDKLSSDLRGAVNDADLALQHVFSSHLVLARAGHVEKSVRNILSEYGRIHGDERISIFVKKTIERENSLDCEKIETVIKKFDKDWWAQIKDETSETQRTAVDSLKTLRNNIAHGGENRTGFDDVEEYYEKSKSFVRAFSLVVLGH